MINAFLVVLDRNQFHILGAEQMVIYTNDFFSFFFVLTYIQPIYVLRKCYLHHRLHFQLKYLFILLTNRFCILGSHELEKNRSNLN